MILFIIKLNILKVKKWHHIGSSYYYVKIKIGSYDSLPAEKTLTLHNVVILIQSVLNRDKNRYYYKILLEKCLFQLAKK